MRTFAVINQKGGCGKTTTAINLAAAFAEGGHRTLLVDMDPQSHCALGLAVPESCIERSVADVLLAGPGVLDWQGLIWQVSQKLDLIPSTTHLAAAEHRLATAPDRDLRLSKALSRLGGEYDLCLIDCPPSISLLTFNGLRAAGEVIIPVETGYFSLHGAIKQAMTLQVLADRVGHEVGFYVLPTMYEGQTELAQRIIGELRKHFGNRVVDLTIRYSACLKEAASLGQPVSEYDPQSPAAEDFRRLAEWLLAVTPSNARLASRQAALELSDDIEPERPSFSPSIQVSPLTSARPASHGGERLADLLQRTKALAQRKIGGRA